ncbi:MAG: RsmF rRNA methyltransferase first C-terminal domain-containing protein [Clostridia bacterium]|nr:RsmF rRNA methyltransferase first C-terminal domain-containing protein [Clostridia bacterium]
MARQDLPQQFIDKMQKQLPESEWEAFFAVYDEKPVKGVRLNVLKGGREALKAKLPFLTEPVEWEENGFYTEREKLGSSVWHDAGLFYSQEPSAMRVAPLLEAQAGEKVLDLCSAPGGKGTQLACAMHGKGVLVLNEPVFSRAKILSQNVERMGIKNAVVTCEMPETLAKKFSGYFDKILVDAPCSGEGMFRKNAEEALREWSLENVALCADRQERILNESVKMLKSGGRLAYSTCTFSMEEDELQVENFLEKHPEMRLLRMEKLLPHTCRGEGHFVAVFEKEGETEPYIRRDKAVQPNARKDSEKAYREFEKAFFKAPFANRLYEANDTLYDLPDGVFDWRGLQVLRVGVRLGELKNGRFEPSHSLAMAIRADACKNVLSLSETDARVEKYLRGETIDGELPNGWCLVCVDGYPLGLGKAVNGMIKNHLPKGLRR